MKVFAISDLHLGYAANREALRAVSPHPEDWLILAGDIGERASELEIALDGFQPKFRRLVWIPGNHELWTLPDDPGGLKGEAKYRELVDLCRRRGVLTPEDPFESVEIGGVSHVIAPLFNLYDYSFRPGTVALERVHHWAAEEGVACADEHFLHPEPHPDVASWCRERIRISEERLGAVPTGVPIVLVNHYPVIEELVRLFRVPRFSPWCGTKLTREWHRRYNVKVVVSGHLHMRATDMRDGVRFEEVSLGYPRQWRPDLGLDSYLREILPGQPHEGSGPGVLRWTY